MMKGYFKFFLAFAKSIFNFLTLFIMCAIFLFFSFSPMWVLPLIFKTAILWPVCVGGIVSIFTTLPFSIYLLDKILEKD